MDLITRFAHKYGQAANLQAAGEAIEQAENFITQLQQQQHADTLPADKRPLYTQLSQMAFDLQTQVMPTIQSDVSPQGKILAKQSLETYNRLMWWIKEINKPTPPVASTNVASMTAQLIKKYG